MRNRQTEHFAWFFAASARTSLIAVAVMCLGAALVPAVFSEPAAAKNRCGSGISKHDRVLFVRAVGGRTDIWAMRGNGSDKRALTSTGTESSAEFSPSGDLIAFGSVRDGNHELYVMSSDGSEVRNLTNTPHVRENKPTWAPDGRRIAFHSVPITESDLDNPDIEVINTDGTGRTNITNSPLVKEVKPAWSPDGALIAFEGGQPALSTAAPNDDIWVMNADGSDRRLLTTHPGREWFPSWSPDSQLIAFMSGRDGNFEIYVMNADGSDQTRLTHNDTFDSLPTWSPDGTRITYGADDSIMIPAPGLFISLSDPTVGDLISIQPDGSDPIRLTDGGVNVGPDYPGCDQTESH